MINFLFVSEIIILGFILTLRFKNYKKQSEELLIQSSIQQEQIFKTVTDYQEKELQRLSSLLHDSVGARLATLRLNLESNHQKNESPNILNSIKEINDLTTEVRNFSHSISPIMLQKQGLIESLNSFVLKINQTKQIKIQLESIGSLQRISFKYELMIYNIIQELIQNILKHAKATEAIVQLILEKDFVSIYIEDNGIGFDKSINNDGLGFLQIKQLISFVKGTIQIKSEINAGCKISIEFPLISNEETNTFITS